MTLILALALSVDVAPASSAQECKVLAAIGQQELSLGNQLAPPLEPAGSYLPICNWHALGLKGFATAKDRSGSRLILHRPKITGSKASVHFVVIYGVRSGHGSECELTMKAGKWHVTSCTRRIAL